MGMTIAPVETQKEAACWLARLRAEDLGEDDVAAFQAWLAADPLHGIAFEAANSAWDIAGSLPRDEFRRARRAMPRRRDVMAGVAALAVGGGLFLTLRPSQAGIYQTKIGERKRAVLDDGSQVFLDTDTRLRARFSEAARNVELEYGRADFQVAPDPRRPFIVSAAAHHIVARGASLDVRRDGENLSVILVHGTAAVTSGSQSPENAVLRDGERLVIDSTMKARTDRPNLAVMLAWRNGQAIFDYDRLGDAVREMNRYSKIKLVVADAAVGGLRISGVYRLGDNISFANSMTNLLPVKIVQDQDRVELVMDQSRSERG
jgi:transmembrane sensor